MQYIVEHVASVNYLKRLIIDIVIDRYACLPFLARGRYAT